MCHMMTRRKRANRNQIIKTSVDSQTAYLAQLKIRDYFKNFCRNNKSDILLMACTFSGQMLVI